MARCLLCSFCLLKPEALRKYTVGMYHSRVASATTRKDDRRTAHMQISIVDPCPNLEVTGAYLRDERKTCGLFQDTREVAMVTVHMKPRPASNNNSTLHSMP